MSFLIFFGLGLTAISWGIKSREEIMQLSCAIVGAILLIWGLFLTPQTFLLGAEAIALVAVFRICVRCCECDG
ncbi:MAG: hypothetical protein AAFO95_20410 [Cyanobacteria bacterium J06600_6]